MVGEPESVVLSVKEKDRKRRRDGSSSRSHHGKKLKEPVACPSSDGALFSAMVGVDSLAQVTHGVGVTGGVFGGGLRLCKTYVDQVNAFPFFLFFLFLFSYTFSWN